MNAHCLGRTTISIQPRHHNASAKAHTVGTEVFHISDCKLCRCQWFSKFMLTGLSRAQRCINLVGGGGGVIGWWGRGGLAPSPPHPVLGGWSGWGGGGLQTFFCCTCHLLVMCHPTCHCTVIYTDWGSRMLNRPQYLWNDEICHKLDV